ncbi:alpha/beta hydrolase [Planomonospora sp. ID91781]|uniref:alpha/beta hydrolase family protein n=1 Tax=Planomonospora sp. ID91781 TaxID=2738135 RepID=UPI001E4519D6|nr:alpha/beta hydrolase [Planomonospora sp. ID91781]
MSTMSPMPTGSLRRALAAALALPVLALPALAAPAAAAAAPSSSPSTGPAGGSVPPGPALALPEPTGPHPVGTTTLHLVDASRPDPWATGGKPRELMVSLWYPARAPGTRRAPYMTFEEASLLLKGLGAPATRRNATLLSRTRTNAFTDAAPIGRAGGLPLVVLSPGFSQSRSSLTALSEDLASRGYAVAGIDHTHEAFGTALPGGRTATCTACEIAERDPGYGKKITRSRAADVSFVLDRLTGADPAWKHGGLIDASRIAMAGHSIGGNSAARVMLTDSRVRAGVNMDGTFYLPLPRKGLSRPFLLLGAARIHDPGGPDRSWDRDWRRMTGWKRWLTVDGADHSSFSDHPLFAKRLGIPLEEYSLPPKAGGAPVKPLPGTRAVAVVRAYVGAFFDLHLRGRPQPLLDRPSRSHPEARFWD